MDTKLKEVADLLGAEYISNHDHLSHINHKDYSFYVLGYSNSKKYEIRINNKYNRSRPINYTITRDILDNMTLEIGVSKDKTPQQIVSDIKRRILKDAILADEMARKDNDHIVKTKQDKKNTMRLLNSIGLKSYNSDDRVYGDISGYSLDIRLYSDGSISDIKLSKSDHNLSIDQLLNLLKKIGE